MWKFLFFWFLEHAISVVCEVDFGWLLRKHFALRIWKSLGSSTLHSENFPLKQSKENKGSPSEAELGFEHVGVTWWRWKCYQCGLTTALESPNPSGKSCVASCCQSCCSVRSEFVPAIGLCLFYFSSFINKVGLGSAHTQTLGTLGTFSLIVLRGSPCLTV